MLQMANAASAQGLEIFKVKLREFLESSETGRQAIGLSQQGESLRYARVCMSAENAVRGADTRTAWTP